MAPVLFSVLTSVHREKPSDNYPTKFFSWGRQRFCTTEIKTSRRHNRVSLFLHDVSVSSNTIHVIISTPQNFSLFFAHEANHTLIRGARFFKPTSRCRLATISIHIFLLFIHQSFFYSGTLRGLLALHVLFAYNYFLYFSHFIIFSSYSTFTPTHFFFGLGQALLKICSDQTWRISLRLCIVLCVSKVYSTVIEFNVWLWNRIRIADYFPALMLPEA